MTYTEVYNIVKQAAVQHAKFPLARSQSLLHILLGGPLSATTKVYGRDDATFKLGRNMNSLAKLDIANSNTYVNSKGVPKIEFSDYIKKQYSLRNPWDDYNAKFKQGMPQQSTMTQQNNTAIA